MASTILMMRGYPGSGKSTRAGDFVAQGYVRVNRDDLRLSMFKVVGLGTYQQEEAVTRAQRAIVRDALACGRKVVVDDTNLKRKYAKDWAKLAVEYGAGFIVQDVSTTADECVKRDAARGAAGGREVGETVIRSLAARFPMGRWWDPEQLLFEVRREEDSSAIEKAVWDPELPDAWIFDLDGTLAINDHGRGWYGEEELKCGSDKLDEATAAVCQALLDNNEIVFFISGRSSAAYEVSKEWLEFAFGAGATSLYSDGSPALLTRKAGDGRKDAEIKHELWERHIKGKYNVKGVFDDRGQVIDGCWLPLGFRVFDVSNGRRDF